MYGDLTDENGQLLTDDLIRFETLQDGVRRVAETIGLVIPNLEHINRTPKPKNLQYRDYFNRRSRVYFESLYEDDCNAFGYEF
jgi:hypothetical protein